MAAATSGIRRRHAGARSWQCTDCFPDARTGAVQSVFRARLMHRVARGRSSRPRSWASKGSSAAATSSPWGPEGARRRTSALLGRSSVERCPRWPAAAPKLAPKHRVEATKLGASGRAGTGPPSSEPSALHGTASLGRRRNSAGGWSTDRLLDNRRNGSGRSRSAGTGRSRTIDATARPARGRPRPRRRSGPGSRDRGRRRGRRTGRRLRRRRRRPRRAGRGSSTGR